MKETEKKLRVVKCNHREQVVGNNFQIDCKRTDGKLCYPLGDTLGETGNKMRFNQNQFRLLEIRSEECFVIPILKWPTPKP